MSAKSLAFLRLFLLLLIAASAQAQSWTNVYSGVAPGGIPGPFIVLDSDGDAYITGNETNADTSLGYVTMKYSSNGFPLWTNHFRGPGYSYMASRGIALDNYGIVYVTGGAADTNDDILFATVAYANGGDPLWTNWYAGNGGADSFAVGVAAGTSGVVYVTGVNAGYATIAYSNNGTPLWTNRYDTTGDDLASAIAVAPNGNVCVTGFSAPPDENSRFTTIAYSSGGIPLWTNFYAGPPDSEATARAMVIDQGNNVYVTGSYGTVAYTGDGSPLWTNEYDDGWAIALAVDSRSNCYVTGSVVDSNGSWDYQTVKYSTVGLPLWTNIVAGIEATGGNMAAAVAVDDSGDVYVTGEGGTVDAGGIYLTVAYSTDGVALWTNKLYGMGYGNAIASDIVIDSAGDSYITGTAVAGEYNQDTTIKFTPQPTVVDGGRDFGFINGQFGFDIYGRVGSSVVVQSSADLQTWLSLVTNTFASNVAYFQDSQSTKPTSRFYRLMSSP
jgi:hypothetical protein